MKKLLLSVAALGCFMSAQAQWTPTTTSLTVPIERNENVGVVRNKFFGLAYHMDQTLIHNTCNVPLYGLGWFDDPQTTFGPSAFLSGYGSIKFFTQSSYRMILDHSGNLGIGTTTPKARLDVSTDAIFGATGTKFNIPVTLVKNGDVNGTDNPALLLKHGTGSNFFANPISNLGILRIEGFQVGKWNKAINSHDNFVVFTDGTVEVGVPAPSGPQGDYKLNVWGRARANEIVVNTTGADFVFANDYRLRPLKEVEQFINTNNHLPEIPSAREMQQNGVAVGELQTKLLQKVEELTLYVIEQNKKMEAQEQKIQSLEQQLGNAKK